MLSRTEERIIHLLASGLQPSQVASVVGVSPALISQLKTQEEFKTALEVAMAETSKGDKEEIALTAKYHAAENALVDQVLSLSPIAELKDVTAALRVVGERQDRLKDRLTPATQSNGTVINQQIITLTLPAHALPEFSTNQSNQIVAIDSKALSPLSANGVVNLFNQYKQTKLEDKEIENDTSRIPSSSEEGSQSPIPYQEAPQLSFGF